MKTVFTILALASLMMLTSCQFSENVYINEDGSGTMNFSMDASEMMGMMAQMGGDDSSNGMDKAMDSTIVFKDIMEDYKDSIAAMPIEERKNLEALEDFRMRVTMDPEKETMFFNLETDFNDANELQDMFKAMNNLSNLKGNDAAPVNSPSSPFSGMDNNGATSVNYAYDGTVFKRIAKIEDKEKHLQSLDSLGESAMMFGGSKYKINYHFPRAVKSFSKEGAMYSEDRKTVTYEVGFMDMLKDPELLNFEVVLENK